MPPRKKPRQQQTSLNAFFASPKPAATAVIDLDSPEPHEPPRQQGTSSSSSPQKKKPPSAPPEIIDIPDSPPPTSSSARKNPLFIPSTPSKRHAGQVVGLMSPRDREEKRGVGNGSVKPEQGVVKPPLPPSIRNPFDTAAAAPAPALDFDVDPLLFDPDGVTLGPEWQACGGRLPYEVLVDRVYVPVAGTRSRLAIGRVLTNLSAAGLIVETGAVALRERNGRRFRRGQSSRNISAFASSGPIAFLRTLILHSPSDLLPTIYLLSNHLAPSYIPTELGVGFQILNKAITEVSGVNRDGLKRLWDRHGDPGDVAFEAKSNLRTLIRPAPLPAHKLYAQLLTIARTKGAGAGKVKGEIVRKLLVQVKGEEVRYLVRTLISHLRIGAVKLVSFSPRQGRTTLLSAMARSFALTTSVAAAVGSVEDSPYHVTSAELRAVMLGGTSDIKGKGKAKLDPAVERARERVEGNVRHPNYDDILAALLERGYDDLSDRVPLSVGAYCIPPSECVCTCLFYFPKGIPLSPMLGSITRSLAEVYTRLGTLPFTAEAKLDGQRVQVHARVTGPSGKPDGGGRWVEAGIGGVGGVGAKRRVWVRLFSRHLEDMTEKYPDVCELVAVMLACALPVPTMRQGFPRRAGLTPPNEEMRALLEVEHIDSFIMDAEIVAVDKDTGAYRTFQELSNRAKKDVKLEDVKVVVGVFAFDLMLANDVAFFEQVVAQKCEGLMVKLLESGEGLTGEDDDADEEDAGGGGKRKRKTVVGGGGGTKKPLPSTYEPDARSQGWLKVKKGKLFRVEFRNDAYYLEGMGDSLDLVPIGAWWGLGRKAGWYSPILLALYNPETGALEAVCKCISGFSDAFYKDLLVRFPPEGSPDKCRKKEPFTYVETGGLRPDLWFEPSEVWEIRGADISLSPVYTAAASHLGSERGLSIRFPRFIRRREDKSWEEATTAEQFAEMYRKQSATGSHTLDAAAGAEEEAEAEAEAGLSGDEELEDT
ncbi:hypothetical protein QFC19_001498 [Naganishia cerealis]|uniref:Uncharacterized protein n=1 Tax=Naganishia cerealis TaxID=610337 RepID=A0ACC2WHP1_9TREE|nr:hypothetical protein QFC19_001498 [Naganishia cerealis]